MPDANRLSFGVDLLRKTADLSSLSGSILSRSVAKSRPGQHVHEAFYLSSGAAAKPALHALSFTGPVL
ncbi:hypothetical protein WJX74_000507 [Apatococcus lobatus]|uniref:Uncharacterized protein n=1 Tax=Apatococcus lobatus TaxID=904363 RepID=A0AAW1Q8Z5_9CHLO